MQGEFLRFFEKNEGMFFVQIPGNAGAPLAAAETQSEFGISEKIAEPSQKLAGGAPAFPGKIPLDPFPIFLYLKGMNTTHLKHLLAGIFFFVVLLTAFFGCFPRKEPAKNEPVEPTPGVSPAVPKEKTIPVTKTEAEDFGLEIETSLVKKDGAALLRAMDWAAVTDAVLADLPENREEGKYQRKAVLESLSQSGGVMKYVTEQVKRGGSYHFLRVVKAADTRPGEQAVLFRFLDPDAGVDYHRLVLSRDVTGRIMIREIYLIHHGETYSESIRRTLAPELYAGGMNGYGAAMSDVVRILYRDNTLLIQAMYRAYENRDYRRVLDLYDVLPRELQENKAFQITRLTAAMLQGDADEYLYVLADLRGKMGDDPCVDFLSLDYFFERGMFLEVLRSMDRIEEIVGHDPYLNLFRCLALTNMGQGSDAKKLYKISVEEDPRLREDAAFRNLWTVVAGERVYR